MTEKTGSTIMIKTSRDTYAKNEVTTWPVPNYWDAIAFLFVLAVILLLGWGAKTMVGHYQLGQPVAISLSPWMLPYYALRTVLRMLIALFFSILFTFIFGTLAAKSRRAEKIIIPAIDILQSVPVLGFLAIIAPTFIALFPGSLLGLECTAIFVIFTAQVWNITLSFYQSLRTIPKELREASRILQLSAWQKFWRLEVPFAMPGLLWNCMMSMSGSWIFLVASEAITVANQTVQLPGIGSYLGEAIRLANTSALIYVIIAMFIVIAIYDQILFRPLVAWSEKFKLEYSSGQKEPQSWLLDLFRRTEFLNYCIQFFSHASDKIINISIFRKKSPSSQEIGISIGKRILNVISILLLISAFVIALIMLVDFVIKEVTWRDLFNVIYLGLITAVRVTVIIIISTMIWVPIGVWIGLNPKATQIAQPIAQFLAAFPVNLLFPVAAIFIEKYHLNVNIWSSPLMILGTQWYILFNVIAGASAIPNNLHQAVASLNVTRTLWWKRLILPGIFPYFVTGAITAAGGAWNISVIAEAISWGNTHLYATGLGSYITKMSDQGNYAHLALGIIVMSAYVLLINRFMWKPLYNLAEERYQLGN